MVEKPIEIHLNRMPKTEEVIQKKRVSAIEIERNRRRHVSVGNRISANVLPMEGDVDDPDGRLDAVDAALAQTG